MSLVLATNSEHPGGHLKVDPPDFLLSKRHEAVLAFKDRIINVAQTVEDARLIWHANGALLNRCSDMNYDILHAIFVHRWNALPTSDEPPAETTSLRPLLTLKQVARLTRLSVSYLRRMIGTGDLPSIRLGRDIRITEEDYLAFLDRHRTPKSTAPETTNEETIPCLWP